MNVPLEPLCEETEKLLRPVRILPNDRLFISLKDDGSEFVTQAYALGPNGEKHTASLGARNEWQSRVPERYSYGGGRWGLAATDFSAILIAANWPDDRIEFADNNVRTTFEYLLTRFAVQTKHAQTKARFKERGEEPDMPKDWIDHARWSLMPHQRVAVATSLGIDGSALFMEQGTGKTPIVVNRLMNEAARLDDGRMYRAIIVCPKNVRQNWANEIARFATIPGKLTVMRGGQLDRVKQLVDLFTPDEDSRWTVLIAGYETVMRSWDALQMIEWDLAVLDESHAIKSPWAKRTKGMMELRDRATNRMILTGTPMANSILDLYYQLEFLGEGMSGFRTWKAFREYYHKYTEHKDEQGERHFLGFQNLPILQERLARVSVMFKKDEVMKDLPSKSYDVEEIEMTKQQAVIYSSVATQLAAEIEEDMDRGGNMQLTITNVLTKLLRLSQITAGYVVADQQFDDDGTELLKRDDRIKFFARNPKIDQLVEDLKAKGPKSKTIVWCCWVPLIKQISERLEAEGIKHVTYTGSTSDREREANQHAFNNDPEVKVFIGNPAAGGVGMNLPGYNLDDDHGTNADHTIYIACNWSHVQRMQSEDRNHGKGRNRVPVRYTDYVVPGSIDDDIRERLMSKKAMAATVQDVRAIMTKLLSVTVEV